MSEYTINLENGHWTGAEKIILTTHRAESSYGQPVAVLVGGRCNEMAFGAHDIIPAGDELPWIAESAATTVAAADMENRGTGNVALLDCFLRK
jgi:hypothetical protein